MVWRATDPEGNEAEKIRWAVVPYTRGKVLDIGCGPYKAFNHFIGIDSGKQWGHPLPTSPVKAMTCRCSPMNRWTVFLKSLSGTRRGR